jgi:hypothetical protein
MVFLVRARWINPSPKQQTRLHSKRMYIPFGWCIHARSTRYDSINPRLILGQDVGTWYPNLCHSLILLCQNTGSTFFVRDNWDTEWVISITWNPVLILADAVALPFACVKITPNLRWWWWDLCCVHLSNVQMVRRWRIQRLQLMGSLTRGAEQYVTASCRLHYDMVQAWRRLSNTIKQGLTRLYRL